MRPTRRGWVVVAGVVAAFVMGVAFGPRGLNGFVAPGVVALGVAAWRLHGFEPPTLSREHPRRAERGGTARVRLAFDTDTPSVVRVVEPLEGDGPAIDRSVSLGRTTLTYDVDLIDRGELTLGPTTIVVQDVLGLLRRTVSYSATGSITVHPRVHALPGPTRTALAAVYGGIGDEREAVEGLRHYRRGDPVRDIHWKSSAAQPDGELLVKRFSAEGGSRVLTIAATAEPGAADAMAEVTASVAVFLLDSGVQVAVETPAGRVDPADPGGRQAVLDHLAGVGPGRLTGNVRRSADVRIEATPDEVTLSAAGRTVDVAKFVTVDPAVTPGEGLLA